MTGTYPRTHTHTLTIQGVDTHILTHFHPLPPNLSEHSFPSLANRSADGSGMADENNRAWSGSVGGGESFAAIGLLMGHRHMGTRAIHGHTGTQVPGHKVNARAHGRRGTRAPWQAPTEDLSRLTTAQD